MRIPCTISVCGNKHPSGANSAVVHNTQSFSILNFSHTQKKNEAMNNYLTRTVLVALILFFSATYAFPQSISKLIIGTEKNVVLDKEQLFLPYKKISSVSLNFDLFSKKNQEVGDKIIIDLFDNQSYSTTIDRVDININGSFTIRTRFDDYPMGYMLISYTDKNVLGTISIPEKNEQYSIKSFAKTETTILKLVDVEKMDVLEGGPSLIPDIDIESIKASPKAKSKNPNDPANIDIMIVYTPFASAWANTYEGSINNTIAQAMAKAQLTLDNSNTYLTLTLVHSALVDYTGSGESSTDLLRLSNWNDGYMDEVHDWREIYGADLVALFSSFSDAGGIAWLLQFKTGGREIGFSVTRIDQASNTYTMIHEMGHNMGAHHHKQQNFQPGPTEWDDWPENTWSAGWRWTGTNKNRYCSVMTYEGGEYFDDGLGHVSVPYFSNPNISYQGVATGHAADGDNARTIREVKHVIADYTESVVGYPTVSTSSVGAITGLSAISGGNVTSEGDSPVIAKGLVWSRYRNYNWLTVGLNQGMTNEGAGTGSFVSNITDLHPNTTYYVRAYATNSQGTRYGELRSFTTEQIFEGGDGTEEFPYLIATAEQLDMVRHCNYDTYFKQIADIDLGTSPWNQGEGWLPIGAKDKPCFATYDGNNHVINGLYINRPESNYIGLFGYKRSSINEIKDLTLANVYVVGKDTIGGLAGYNEAIIINCNVSGEVAGNNRVGGLAGHHLSGLMQNSYSTGNISGNEMVGGLIGFKESASIIDACYASGNINGSKQVGGLVGYLNGGTLSKSFNLATVNASNESVGGLVGYSSQNSKVTESFSNGKVTTINRYAGGIIGFSMFTTIENCYNLSTVAGNNRIGGIVGYAVTSTVIKSCYSNGAVSGGTSNLGGLVGQNISATVTNSFWDTETSKQTTSAGGTGLTTSQMQRKLTYTNATWDFKGAGSNDIWNIGNSRNNGYPYLNWQHPDDLPDFPAVVSTTSISTITNNSALGAGNITELGSPNPTQHGFCWNTTGEPTIADNKIENGAVSATGSFNSNITGLDQGTLYYARAFASNLQGTSYGETFSFRTLPTSPLPLCEALDNCDFAFTSGGSAEWFGQTTISNDGVDAAQSGPIRHNQQTWVQTTIQGPGIIKFYWKVSTEENFDKLTFLINDVEKLSISGNSDWQQVEFTIEEESEVYAKWIYSKDQSNGSGLDAAWLDQFEFTPIVYTIPTVQTLDIINITQGTAQSGGDVIEDGGKPITARGVVWSTLENPTLADYEGLTIDGSGMSEFTSYISGLQPNTMYYIRAYATNGIGTAYGNQKTFTTLSSIVPIAPDGLGTEDNPYLISSLNNLLWLAYNDSEWDKHYLQIANIDASETSGINGGEGFLPIGNGDNRFSGSYNGGSFTINGLYINRSENYQGLFGYVNGGFIKAKLENISLTNANISGNSFVGALAGSVADCNIINCAINANVNGSGSTGGLIGSASSSTINSSYSSGEVNGFFLTGGLVGNNNNTTVINSYSLCNVSGTERIGGLIGNNSNTEIENCYSTGLVIGNNDTGGLIGLNTNATVTNCYWDIEKSNQSTSAAGTGKTTTEMTYPYGNNTYDNWNFEVFWADDSDLSFNQGYPFLRMYITPELSTKPFTDITQTSVKTGGIISNDGGTEVIETGVVWYQSNDPSVRPTIESNHGITYDGAGSGEFISQITGLNPGWNYVVRAYSSNAIGTSYGNTLNLKINSVYYYISHLFPNGSIDGQITQYVQDGGSTSLVTAVPNEGFYFDSWSDGVTDNPRNDINVTSNIMVYPIFRVIMFTITATSGDNGSISPSGQVQCSYNSSQTFYFNPNDHYVIGDVIVDGENIGSVYEYTFENVTSEHTIHVNFLKGEYFININANNEEGSVLVNGSLYAEELYLEALSEVTIEAFPSDGWQFKQWDGDIVSTNATVTFTLENSIYLNAIFEVKSYPISANANPVNAGIITGTGSYNHNSTVNLVATANAGYDFVNWTEDGTEISTNPAYSFTATAERSLAANFATQSYAITAVANPVGGGSITGAGNYNHGSAVNLVASPNEGYEFVNWTEDGTEISTNPAYSFTATAEKNLVANFATQSYAITAVANPVEGGTITGAGSYDHGSTVNLVATPNAGYVFVNWTDGGSIVSTDPNYSFTANADRNLIANFSLINSIIIVSSDKLNLNVYPNPAKDILNIKFFGNENINDPIKIYLYNSVGKVVKENFYYSTEGILEIPVSDIPTGLYLIDVQVNNKSIGKGRVMIIK